MSKLNELEKAKYAAASAFNKYRREVNSEAGEGARRAKEKVEAKHKDRVKELYSAQRAAETAWQTELDATATHEWEGKAVSYQRNVGRSWSPKLETVLGVVEVRRSNTQFSSNVYPPQMGSAFVRLLNKDGSVGKRIDTWGGVGNKWKLVEPALAAATGTAETNADLAQGEASQSGPQGNAQ